MGYRSHRIYLAGYIELDPRSNSTGVGNFLNDLGNAIEIDISQADLRSLRRVVNCNRGTHALGRARHQNIFPC